MLGYNAAGQSEKIRYDLKEFFGEEIGQQLELLAGSYGTSSNLVLPSVLIAFATATVALTVTSRYVSCF